MSKRKVEWKIKPEDIDKIPPEELREFIIKAAKRLSELERGRT